MVMENYVVFAPWANFVIAHVLSLGAAAMFAGLVYFLVTAKQISPRYRIANYLGAVVMASAVLELGNQYLVWRSTFNPIGIDFAGPDGIGATLYAATGTSRFSNGYRYVNWSIDVPVLLTQMVVVLGLAGRRFWSPVLQFTAAGLLMVYTGYIGQFFEADPSDGAPATLAAAVLADPSILTRGGGTFGDVGPTLPYWIWFAVSCVFYAWILVLVAKVGLSKENLAKLPPAGRWWMKAVVFTLFGSWMLYVVGYLVPAFAVGQEAAVARQIAYTIADIVSKVIYGVMIGYVAQLRSNAEGYDVDRLDRLGYDSGGRVLGEFDPVGTDGRRTHATTAVEASR